MADSFFDPVLRIFLFVFLVITLGLTGSLIATQDNVNPQVNFGIFASVFGLVFGVFYAGLAAFVQALSFPLVLAALDFLNFVFTFAAATSIAVAIRVHSCNNQDYLDSNAVAQGEEGRCRKAQASVAFFFFAFFVFLLTLVYSVVNVIKFGAFNLPGSRARRSAAAGVPTMTQV